MQPDYILHTMYYKRYQQSPPHQIHMIRSESKVAQTNGPTVWYRNSHMLGQYRLGLRYLQPDYILHTMYYKRYQQSPPHQIHMIRSESKVAQTNGPTVWYRNSHMLGQYRLGLRYLQPDYILHTMYYKRYQQSPPHQIHMIRSESKVAQTNGPTVWYRNSHMLTDSRPV